MRPSSKSRLGSVWLWSALAAAFIGPGTVTTCAKAGQQHGLVLLWALAFSIVACCVLQDAAARLALGSGLGLAEAIRARCRGTPLEAPAVALLLGAIVLGCAAYQAGNVIGAAAGLALLLGLPPAGTALGLSALAAVLLWFGSLRGLARALGVLVAVMGVAFLIAAVHLRPAPAALLRGTLVPALPDGSLLLVLALIGTTVVPYNLFLGARLALAAVRDGLRAGLFVALALGGVISMAVVVVGTAVGGEFGYEALAAALEERLGPVAPALFAIGLFAAGASSALTAPLAAALVTGNLFARRAGAPEGVRAPAYRLGWGVVVLAGAVFGSLGLKPIPAIVLAQALNGVLLPLAAVFLWRATNDAALMGREGRNGPLANVLIGAVTLVAAILGARGVWEAVRAALE